MKIVILTTQELFYLPDELAYLLRERHAEDEYRVLIVPAEHYVVEKKARESIARRVLKSFGLRYFVGLATRGVLRKLLQHLPRKQTDTSFYSMASVCRTFGVPLFHVEKLNSQETIDELTAWGVDLMVSVSCPQVFKRGIIDAAPKGVLNLHCSPLPEYRGLYPAFWMLKNDEQRAGATLFFVNERIDGGDILLQEHYPVEKDDTLHRFVKRSKRRGSELIVRGIQAVREGGYETTEIDEDAGSYYTWPTREEVRDFCTRRKLR